VMKGLCITGIRRYQRWLSPLLGTCCRFEPSCSEYMREAIEHYGVWRGVRLGLRRLWRCRPGFAGGYDPVPDADYFELPTFDKMEERP
jgi:putative membrane protein insertion efficiency factor